MLRHIHVESTMFDPADEVGETRKDLLWWMQALVQRNQDYLKQRPDTPRLYKSGVVYERPKQTLGEAIEEVQILRRELGARAHKPDVARVLDKVQQVFGGEHFCDIGVILEQGAIDCFPMSQKIIVRSRSTGMYELLSLAELRFVYPAYEALSYNFETGCQEFKSIIGWVDRGLKPVSKIHLSNGSNVVATDNHVFWTVAGQRQANGLSDSRRVEKKTLGEFVDDYLDFQSGNLSRAQFTARSKFIHAAQIPTLDAINPSRDEAYLAGIYAAEGFQSNSVTGIAQHKPEVRRQIEAVLDGLSLSYSYDTGGRGGAPGSGAQYRLLGGASSERIAQLRTLGVDSFSKQLPQAFLSAGYSTIRAMLDAHGDGDGWRPKDRVYRKSNVNSMAVEYSTSSDTLKEQIQLGLLLVGSPMYVHYQENHQGAGDRPIWRVTEYNQQAVKLHGRRAVMSQLGMRDLTYSTIRGAERLGPTQVGCIEVEGNHNFFLADGTLAANCDGLACWRVAELRQKGIQAEPYMTHRNNLLGGTTYHALVLWPPMRGIAEVNGVPQPTSEDPSLLLGMGGPARAKDRQEEIRKNEERSAVLASGSYDLGHTLDSIFGGKRRQIDMKTAMNDLLKRMP